MSESKILSYSPTKEKPTIRTKTVSKMIQIQAAVSFKTPSQSSQRISEIRTILIALATGLASLSKNIHALASARKPYSTGKKALMKVGQLILVLVLLRTILVITSFTSPL